MSAVAPRSPSAPPLPSREAVLEQAGQENFTVASAVLGRRRQADLMAIYGYARLVDDVGDEAAGDRAALLDEIEAELDGIYSGRAPRHPVMVALATTIGSRRLPPGPFKRLIAANRQDQHVTRYATFAQLLDYCSLSAAPVGELVLHVFGAATPERVALSDRVCAGLQVLEHLQDVAEDYQRGRVYLPQEDLERAGVAEAELRDGAPPALLALEHERVSGLLDAGAPLARTLPLRPRFAVAGFIAGGRTALEAVLRGGSRQRTVFAAAFAKAAIGR
jgi:squalene synthase HpnC